MQQQKLVTMQLDNLSDLTASSAPAPGGGSISAISAAMGASLICMVCELSLGKTELETPPEEFGKVRDRCDEIRRKLLAAVDADTDAFSAVMAAFAMSKQTEEEKQLRRGAIQDAFCHAAEVPLSTAELACALFADAMFVLEKGNPNARSDAAVALLQLQAGCMGALYNVQINLPSIKDEGIRGELAARADRVEAAMKASTGLPLPAVSL